MRSLHAETEIDAPAGRVWEILSDLPAYGEWNPFITSAAGELRPGARLEITIAAPGLRPVTFRPRLLEVEPGRLLRWKGSWLIPGLFDGYHSLRVDPLGSERARFTSHEDVSGLLLPVLRSAMKASQRGFEELCDAVKRRAEGTG